MNAGENVGSRRAKVVTRPPHAAELRAAEAEEVNLEEAEAEGDGYDTGEDM